MSSPVIEAVAGGLGSLVGLFCTYPLKTVYTLQAIRMEEKAKGRKLTVAERREFLKHPIKILQALWPSVSVLYTGLKPAALETAASNAIYFYFYSLLRAGVVSGFRRQRGFPPVGAGSIAARTEDIGIPASLLVAAAAGAINMAITSPAQVLVTQMQAKARLKQRLADQGQSTEGIQSDVWGVTTAVYNNDGVRGFWKGLAPSLILVVNPAVQYMAYEWLTQRQMSWRQHKLRQAANGSHSSIKGGKVKLRPDEVFLIGAAAKVFATIVTYPMIVVKSRLQATGSHTAAELQYNGTCDAICRIAHEEGFNGFYKGMKAKILQTALNAALMLMIKEQVHTGAVSAVKTVESLIGGVRLPQRRTPTGVAVHMVKATR